GTVLPNASATFTCTGGAIVAPATTAEGGTTNDIVAAAAGETVNEPLAAVGSTPLDAVSDLAPTRSTLSAAKLPTPCASVAVARPPVSVPVPTSASATDAPGAPLPNASVTLTWRAGASATPATTSVGWPTNWSAAGAAAFTVNAPLVASGSSALDAVSCLEPV